MDQTGLVQRLDASSNTDQTIELLQQSLQKGPNSLNSDVMTQFVAKMKQQKTPVESVISLPVLSAVHQSDDRFKSWLKFEILLTKCLTSRLFSAQQVEDVVLPLLKNQLDPDLLMKFGSCLKGVIASYRKSRTGPLIVEEEFVQVLEWIGWLCTSKDPFE